MSICTNKYYLIQKVNYFVVNGSIFDNVFKFQCGIVI